MTASFASVLFELFDAFSPRDHLSPGASAVVVFGLAPAALLWLLRAMRRRAREAERALDRYEPTPDGQRLLEGHVLKGDDDAPAAVLQVDEDKRTRQGKSSTYTVWVERQSRTTARPFSVREADGRVTRVEPGDAPYIDRRAMTEALPEPAPSGATRTRTLHLRAGTRVFVYGRVAAQSAAPSEAGGYRDAGPSTALQEPEDGPLEVHAESPVPALREALARARRWQWLGPLAIVLVEAVLSSTYLAQVTAGRVVDATVTSVSTAVVHGRSGGRYNSHRTTTLVRVVCATPSPRAGAARGDAVCSQLAQEDVAAFRQGDVVSVLTVDGWPEANAVGAHGSLHWMAAAFGLLAVFGVLAKAPFEPIAPWRAPRAPS